MSKQTFLTAVFILALAVGSFAQQPGSIPEWKRYELGKRSFSVLLPAEPSETRQSTTESETQIGADMYLYGCQSENAIYVSQVTFLSKRPSSSGPTATQSFYQGVWKGLKTSLDEQLKQAKVSGDTKLIRQKQVSFAGSPGVEFVFVYGNSNGRLIVTVVENRAFAGMILGSESVRDQLQQQFFSSFVILPGRTGKVVIDEE